MVDLDWDSLSDSPPAIPDQIAATATNYGVNPNDAVAIANFESGMNPDAHNPSGANGIFQVMPATWNSVADNGANPSDPTDQIKTGVKNLANGRDELSQFLGREPNRTELYSAQLFGASGAKKLLSADDDTPIEDLFGSTVAKQNNLSGKNVGEVKDTLAGWVGGPKKGSLSWDDLSDTPPEKRVLNWDDLSDAPTANFGDVYTKTELHPDFSDVKSEVSVQSNAEPSLTDMNAAALKISSLGANQKTLDELANADTPIKYALVNAKYGNQADIPSDEDFAKQHEKDLADRDANLKLLQSALAEQQQQQEALRATNTGGLSSAKYYAKQSLGNAAPLAVGAGLSVALPQSAPVVLPAIFGTQAYAQKYGEARGSGADEDAAAKLAATSAAINAGVAAIPGGAIASKVGSPLAKAALVAGANEVAGTIGTPTEMLADKYLLGQDQGDIGSATLEAAKTNVLPSLIFGAVGGAHGRIENAADRVTRLTRELGGSDPDIAAGLSQAEVNINAGKVRSDQTEVPGQGPVGEDSGAQGGDDLQRDAQTGTEAGDQEGKVAPQYARSRTEEGGTPELSLSDLSARELDLLRRLGYVTNKQIAEIQEAKDGTEYNQWGERSTGEQEKQDYLGQFPEANAIRDRSLAGIREESERISSEIQGDPFAERTGSGNVGPYDGFTSKAWESNAGESASGGRGNLHVDIYGNGQHEEGLTDSPLLRYIVTPDGELMVNGPDKDSNTFAELRRLGRADFAHDATDESDFWTKLTNPDGTSISLAQNKNLLADVHARARAWFGADRIGLNWRRDTGSTGGPEGRQTAVYFAKENEGAPQGALSDSGNRFQSVDEARQALASELGPFGKGAVTKLEKQGLTFTDSSKLPDITNGEAAAGDGTVHGVTSDGRAHVIWDQVPTERIGTTAIHEVVHNNLKETLTRGLINGGVDEHAAGKQAVGLINRLTDKVLELAKNNKNIGASVEHAHTVAPEAQFRSEALAQTVGDLFNQSAGKRFLGAVKLGLNRMGVPLDWLNANEAALREIGVQNLKAVAEKKGEGIPFAAQKQQPSIQADTGERVSKPRYRPAIDAQGKTIWEPATKLEGRLAGETTGIKNAMVAESRETRGVEAVTSKPSMSLSDRQQAAREALEHDPGVGRRLVEEMHSNPRPLSQAETDIFNQHHNSVERARDAVAERVNNLPDGPEKSRAMLEMALHDEELDRVDRAARAAGAEASLSLSARKAEVTKEGLFRQQAARMQAAGGGRALDEAQKAQIRSLTDKLKMAEDALADHLSNNGASKTKRSANPRQRYSDLKAQVEQRLAELGKKAESVPQMARSGAPQYARTDDLHGLIRQMANALVDGGNDSPHSILDQIHADVGERAGLTRKQTANIISGVTRGVGPTKSELQTKIQAVRKQLRQEFNPKDPNAPRQKQLREQMAEIQRRIDSSDFSKGPRKTIDYNAQTRQMIEDRDRLKNELEEMHQQHQRMGAGAWSRAGDLATNAYLFNILSSLNTPYKLGSAVMAQLASMPMRDATVSLARMIGGEKFRNFANQSTYGQGLTTKGYLGLVSGLKKAPAEAWNQIVKGASSKEALYGKDSSVTDIGQYKGGLERAWKSGDKLEKARAVLGLVGSSHSAIKEFLSTPAFTHYTAQLEVGERRALAKQGLSQNQIDERVNSPSQVALRNSRALSAALEEKMQGDNFLSDSWKSAIRTMESKGDAGKTAAFVLKNLVPIVKVPPNIINNFLSLQIGGLKAGFAAARGFKGLDEAQTRTKIDYIMRNIGMQGAGMMIFALGTAFSGQLKPWFDEKDKSGNMMARLLTHSPVMLMLREGVMFHDLFNKYHRGGASSSMASLQAIGDYTGEITSEEPWTSQYEYLKKDWERSKRSGRNPWAQFAGNEIRSHLIPQALQQEAKGTAPYPLQIHGVGDPYKGYRRPKNIVDDIKLGIPGLREQVSP